MSGGPYPVADLAAYLTGRWRLDRTMRDHRAGQTGTMTGVLEIAPDGESHAWRERAELAMGAYRGPAWRDYRLGFVTPRRAAVYFDDGRPFHELDLSDGFCRQRHDCPPDLYSGVFIAFGADRWQMRWRVRGPKKRLHIVTDLARDG
ncbi:MAG: hypothetical protein H2040_12405 [Euryhalocaulis sp.]|uniref:DUF6314 family protein n=1 Tax=Euryhalocaulis sp. TaxID=2744307 RepID=UPI001796335C|nr:DUF6314 family protein [Euryhalocaulis sp.]MBA4802653.1 hypothetical protein [Euryhalocaulis sp.]